VDSLSIGFGARRKIDYREQSPQWIHNCLFTLLDDGSWHYNCANDQKFGECHDKYCS